MKNNIAFFTHEVDASGHRKFLILRTYYGEGDRGWAMEGRFWRLNGLIGKEDNCRLDLTKKGAKALIAHDLGIGLDDLDEFLTVLRDEAELIHDDGGVIWTDQTQKDLSRAFTAREAARRRRGGDNRELGDETQTSGDECKTSADENHGGGGGKDRTGEESYSPENSEKGEEAKGVGARKRADPPPPLSGDQTSPGGKDLLAYALKLALERKAKDPQTYAKKLAKEPDVIAAFNAQEAAAEKPKTRFLPDPPPCACGGKLKADIRNGFARCLGCGKAYEYDHVFEVWAEDEKQNTA